MNDADLGNETDEDELPVIDLSKSTFGCTEPHTTAPVMNTESVESLMRQLLQQVSAAPVFSMEIRRDFILSDSIKSAQRRGFSPLRNVKVLIRESVLLILVHRWVLFASL